MRTLPALVAILLVTLGGRAAKGQLIISEFRWNGPNGPNDEFVEIYNNSGADFTVQATDGSAGFAVAASNGVIRFTIPNGTVIPNRGHFLGANSIGYSLGSYPAGNGTVSSPDATYTTDIPLNAGIALFATANPTNFTLANRIDAVGATAESNTLYKEGVGVRNLNLASVNYSYLRRAPGGCIGTSAFVADSNCASETLIKDTFEPLPGLPQDTNNNRADFIFADTNGTAQTSPEGMQQRLGAPGPENLSSPIVRHDAVEVALVDPSTCPNCPPNRVRNPPTMPPQLNQTFGTVLIRRKIINRSGANITRLRFRVLELTTFPAATFSLPPPPNDSCGAPGAMCAADLRALTSTDTVEVVGGSAVLIRGTTLEQAASPGNQPSGGAFNSSLSASAVTLATPLAPVDNPNTPNVKENEINLQFSVGVQMEGVFRFTFLTEALP